MDCALWIRAAERLAVSPDPLVPGPLGLDRPPAPISAADETHADHWLGWWHSLVTPGQSLPDPHPEPAYGTPDPLGLAPYPALAALVARRWTQARQWQTAATPQPALPHMTINNVVREVEATAGRRLLAFKAEFFVLPVRDDAIRQVTPERFLVPHRIYDTPQWADWLRDLVTRIGL